MLAPHRREVGFSFLPPRVVLPQLLRKTNTKQHPQNVSSSSAGHTYLTTRVNPVDCSLVICCKKIIGLGHRPGLSAPPPDSNIYWEVLPILNVSPLLPPSRLHSLRQAGLFLVQCFMKPRKEEDTWLFFPPVAEPAVLVAAALPDLPRCAFVIIIPPPCQDWFAFPARTHVAHFCPSIFPPPFLVLSINNGLGRCW